MTLKWCFEAQSQSLQLAQMPPHVLLLLTQPLATDSVFYAAVTAKLQRTRQTWSEIQKNPLHVDTAHGGLLAVCWVADLPSRFELHTRLRKALQPLLHEQPGSLAIVCEADNETQRVLATEAAYVAALNAQALPNYKQDSSHYPLTQITFYGVSALPDLPQVEARVAANTLCRRLTMQAPNLLTPENYRQHLLQLAEQQGWQSQVWTLADLRAMGAGAFVAVAQGSTRQDAALVKLSYRHANATKTLALVGKGVCFDTGGHNLKSSKYMLGMHHDMNGSAVAVSVLQAVSALHLPVNVDCWLALAENHIGPDAYKQNDIITALNGLRIEVMHTDAEGRMLLADTLTLASRTQPNAILDFATLTGSMQTALGTRMSGILGNQPALVQTLVDAGNASGERLVAFPYAEDYDAELESTLADIKQCTLESDADHMLAARFLGKFIEGEVDWCHIDLSSYAHKDGLGAVCSEINGFGVALTLHWLKHHWLG